MEKEDPVTSATKGKEDLLNPTCQIPLLCPCQEEGERVADDVDTSGLMLIRENGAKRYRKPRKPSADGRRKDGRRR